MPDKYFLSPSGADVLTSLPGERVLWSGHCAVAEYAFEEPASLPRWTLPEETEVVVTDTRVVYIDVSRQSTGELRWPWPQHLRVQPGNRETGRAATVTQIQLVCGGADGAFPALVFAGGDLTKVGDADRLANGLRQAIARYRVEHAAELGLTMPQARMLSRLVIGPEFTNHLGGEGQTVSLLGSTPIARTTPPEPDWPPAPPALDVTPEPFLAEYLAPGHARSNDYVAPGHARNDEHVAPGHARSHEYIAPGHAFSDEHVAPSHARSNEYIAPGHAFSDEHVAPGQARSNEEYSAPGHALDDYALPTVGPAAYAPESYVSQAHATDPYSASRHTETPDSATPVSATPDYTTRDYVTPDFATQEYATREYATPDFATQEYATPDFATQEYATSHNATPDYATPDYADVYDRPLGGRPGLEADVARAQQAQRAEQVAQRAEPDLASRAADLAARVANLVADGSGLDQPEDRFEAETTNLSAFLNPNSATYASVGALTGSSAGTLPASSATDGLDAIERAELIRRTAARFAGNSARARNAEPGRADDELGATTRGNRNA